MKFLYLFVCIFYNYEPVIKGHNVTQITELAEQLCHILTILLTDPYILYIQIINVI